LKLDQASIAAPLEVYYNPSLIGVTAVPLIKMISEAIYNCPIDTRKNLSSNIIVYGGLAAMKNARSVLEEKLKEVLPQNVIVKLPPAETPLTYAWVGASIENSLSSFAPITKKEYQEKGSRAEARLWPL